MSEKKEKEKIQLNETGIKVQNFLKQFGVLIIAALFFLGTWAVTSMVSSSRKSSEEAAQGQIAKAQSNIDIQNAAAAAKSKQVSQDVTGLSNMRKTGDDAAATRLMQKVTTWNSFASYMNARQDVMKTFELDEESQFMKVFMPQLKSIADGNGKQYNRIDTFDLNTKFKNLDTHVIKVAGTTYEYFATVQITSTAKDSAGTSSRFAVLTYKTDPDHNITSLNALPLVGTPKTSGNIASI